MAKATARTICRAADPPDDITYIIGHQQSPSFVEGNADGSAHSIVIAIQKASENVGGGALGLPLRKGTKITL